MDIFSWDISYLLAFICILLVIYLNRETFSISNAYWKEIGVPYVPRFPVIGSNIFKNIFLDVKQFHDLDAERCKKFGGMFGVYEGTKPVLYITDLDLVKNIWVKDFASFTSRRDLSTGNQLTDNMMSMVCGSDKWKRIRCTVSPSFATGKIKKMTDIFLSCAKVLSQNFAETNGKSVDVKTIFNTFTMDAIASIAFATKVHSYKDPNNLFVQKANQIFTRQISLRFVAFMLVPGFLKFFKISPINPNAINFFRNACLRIIEDRKKTGTVRHDFLQSLIDAEKEGQELDLEDKNLADNQENEDEKFGHEENPEILKTPKNMRVLTHEEMISQCVMFFLAGFDTTASALSIASYQLAANPEIQDKLIQDVDSTIEKHDRKLTYEAIQDMKYLDYIVQETLRLFSPAIRIERMADKDYTLGDTGVTIKKGTVVCVPVYVVHHDPNVYEDPEKFIPERFTPEEKAKRNPYSFLTFGLGPRNCVAMRFALMEIKICLAYLISQFRIKTTEETKEIDIFSGFGILQPKNVNLSFQLRNNRVFDGI